MTKINITIENIEVNIPAISIKCLPDDLQKEIEKALLDAINNAEIKTEISTKES